MESTTSFTSNQEDEISLKQFILNTIALLKYLWRKRLLLITGGLLGAGLGLTYSLIAEPDYKAKLTFVLEDSDSNPLGAYVGLASQFGINLGMGGNSGIFSGDNILEFLKSKLMIDKTLLTSIHIGDKEMTLAGLYIEISGLKKKWSNKRELRNIRFPANLPRDKFSIQQDSVLDVIYDKLLKKNLSIVKPDKQLNFIVVECTTPNEIFSKYFVERLVNEATSFYIETKTQRSKSTVDRLQAKADSIEHLLNKKTYSVAATEDMNLNPARSITSINTELATRDKFILQTIYTEVLKNLEISKMAIDQESPIIQVVDTPLLPLERKKLGILAGTLIGGFIGGFLIVLCLISLRAYKRIISE